MTQAASLDSPHFFHDNEMQRTRLSPPLVDEADKVVHLIINDGYGALIGYGDNGEAKECASLKKGNDEINFQAHMDEDSIFQDVEVRLISWNANSEVLIKLNDGTATQKINLGGKYTFLAADGDKPSRYLTIVPILAALAVGFFAARYIGNGFPLAR